MKNTISVALIAVLLSTTHIYAFADNLSYAVAEMNLDCYYNHLAQESYDTTVKVAVVDSGVADIEFLYDKLTEGYDFIDDDSDPTNDTSSESHGTSIASIIADVTGDLPIYIMPVRVLEEKNVLIEDLVSGIEYAVDNGADIINLSVGGSISDCSEIDSAIDYAYKNNVTVVVSAGNERKEISGYCPAHNESAITVSSVDFDRKFAKRFSNFGEYVDCCAPGVNLVGYNADGMPRTVNGTSFSAALISAGTAMLKLEHPEYSVDEIQDKLKSVCFDLGEEGFDNYYGFGIPQFEKLFKAQISIVNSDKYNGKYIDYKSTVTFSAETMNRPENSVISWFIDDIEVDKGDAYTFSRAKENFTVQAKLVVDDEIISESEIEQIYVRNSFWDKLLAFFRFLFGRLPIIVQAVVEQCVY